MSLQISKSYKVMPASHLILFIKICRSSELEYFWSMSLYVFLGHNFAKNIFGSNFWNIARMHTFKDYVEILEKSLEPFFRKVAKTSFLGRFWPKLRK